MYAGFDYSYLVQGRDQFSNNIALVLSGAVGSNFGSVLSLTTNGGVTYRATITDDSAAGVYLVSMSLPKL